MKSHSSSLIYTARRRKKRMCISVLHCRCNNCIGRQVLDTVWAAPDDCEKPIRCKGWMCNDPPAVEGVAMDMAPGADPEMLPALGLLHLECKPQAPSLAFFENFVAERQFSNCPITAIRCEWEFQESVESYRSKEDKDPSRFLDILLG
jgi:hypothetical protein